MIRTANRRTPLWVGLVGLLAPLAVFAAASPSDAVLQPGCGPDPAAPGGILCVYTPANASVANPATFTVPPGTGDISVRAFGAKGGSSASVAGGVGTAVTTILLDANIDPGDQLVVTAGTQGMPGSQRVGLTGGTGGAGGAGQSAGGAGGSTMATGAYGGGGGGGSSSVLFIDNTPVPAASQAYTVVAAGGGGAGGGGTAGTGGGAGGSGTTSKDGLPGTAGSGAGANPGSGGVGTVPGAVLTNGLPGGGSGTGGAGGGQGAGSLPGVTASVGATDIGGGGGGGAGGSAPIAGATYLANNVSIDGRVEIRYTPCAAPSSVSLGEASVIEGDTPAMTMLKFPIVVTNPSPCSGVDVKLAVFNGSALFGSDYTVTFPTTVSIMPNVALGEFVVTVIGDNDIEHNEFLFARIVSATAPLASETAPPPTFSGAPRLGIIINDDGVILACLPGSTPPPGYNPIVGSFRDDDLIGTPGNDIIYGGPGNDRINGAGGDDIICGGPGNDRLLGGPGDDQISGDSGRDRLVGGPGTDKLVGYGDIIVP